MKRLVYLLLFSAMPIGAMQKLDRPPLLSLCGDVSLLKGEDGFSVLKGGEITSVNRQDVDSTLRSLETNEQLTEFLKQGGYIRVSQYDETGEYRLEGHMRGLGGLGGGACIGAWAGYGIVFLSGHAIIGGISGLVGTFGTPAAGYATGAALEKFLAAPIHYAALTVGAGCGILGGVASGPI